jgi:t-SNARE syntaxin family protein
MDPFNALYQSTTPLIDQLEDTSPQSLDFLTLQNEIVSCIHDLEESIRVVESNPTNLLDNPFADISTAEINTRKQKVTGLNNRLRNILSEKNVKDLKGGYGINPFEEDDHKTITGPLSIHQTPQEPHSVNPNDGPNLDVATREYHQQLLQRQDNLISNELSQSINNLHQQARTIGDELDYQQDLLDEVDDHMERLNFRIVNTGMKKINNFLAANEMGGNCCIAVLIVVLIVILVLLIIA